MQDTNTVFVNRCQARARHPYAVTWAFKQPVAKPIDRLALAAIAFHARLDLIALAGMAESSVRQTRASTERLIAAGLVAADGDDFILTDASVQAMEAQYELH